MSYFEVKPLTMLFLCSYTRLSKLLVTPIYNVPFRLLAKIYIKHKPFSSQVEDKPGFPLKTCGNDKPYILCLLTYCLYYREGSLKVAAKGSLIYCIGCFILFILKSMVAIR